MKKPKAKAKPKVVRMAAPKARGVVRKIVHEVIPEIVPKLDAPVDLAAIREQIKRAVGNNAVTMVQSTVKEANKGRFLAMKLLFEMVGLYPATNVEEAFEDDSLAKTLLRRLQLPEETELEPFVTKEYELDTTMGTSNPVK